MYALMCLRCRGMNRVCGKCLGDEDDLDAPGTRSARLPELRLSRSHMFYQEPGQKSRFIESMTFELNSLFRFMD
jgi:hypothetical protein